MTDSNRDYNPYLRKRGDFLSTKQTDSIVTSLKALLATPVKIKGIDVSHWNGAIDWKKVKESGVEFAIIKATEADYFLDDKWEFNWRAAIDHEIIVTPYHFFRDNYKGAPQVNWFLQNTDEYLNAVDGRTIAWADVETNNGSGITARQNRLQGFCAGIVGHGLQAGYYSSKSKWESLIGNPSWTNDYKQWVASWTPASAPVLPNGWTTEQCKFWQFGIYPTYSWTFPVSGAGTVDVNWFYGTAQELRDLLGYSAPPPPPSPDCCDEVREEIQLLYNEIGFLKGEIGTLNQRAELTEQEIGLLNQDMVVIEGLLAKVREIFC